MDVRHPLYQAIASVLAGILILNPIVAAAAELAVDAAAGGNTHLGVAGNGVPVVNIATPNGAGLSHNKFTDYNVGQNGLILNNATGKTQSTQLGGIIIGNPNLQGQAAQKILNEVTGANRSQLQGYTEVAGQSAHVIVANPNGITCNGCGFINTPRATLTTGKPILNGGRLQGYDVDGGDIAIEGAGLNAGNLDRFELITRSAKLNADLYANQLDVVTGRNQVDAETLAATAKPDNGSAKPQLAIDSSALGGMYAGAIRLVGTEQGVGVKLAGNMAASAGDIQIDANGQLSLAQTSTAGSLRAKAQDITVNGPAYAAGNVELQANGALSNQGQLAAGSRVQLQGAQVSNSGIVEAGINPDNSRNAQGDVAINAQSVRNSGSVVASRSLDVNASGTLDNQGGSLRGANTTLNATTLNNQGRVLAGNALSLSAQKLSNVNGQVGAQFIQVRGGPLDNRLGLFSAEQTLTLQLGGLNNQGGTLSSRGSLVADVSGTLDNSQNGTLVSAGDQRLNAGQMNNRGGRVSSQGALSLNAGQLDNRAGSVVSATHLNLAGSSLDNRDQGLVSAGQGAQLTLDSLNNAGAIQSDGALQLQARTVANAAGGQIAAKGNLNAQVGSLTQNGGELLSEAYLQVSAQQVDNHQGGWIGAMQGIELQADALFNQGGEISSRGASNLRVASVDNSAGRIASDGQLQWQGDSLVNRAGSLVGQGGLSVNGRSLDNSQGGKLSSQRDLTLNLAERLDNQAGGQLLSEGALNLSAAQVDNRTGTLSSAGAMSLASSTLNNQGGKLVTDSTLNLATPTLDNRQGGVISAKGALALRGTTLLNSQAGRILGGADLLLAQTLVDNSDRGHIEAVGRVAGQIRTLDQHGAGQLISNGGIDLDFAGGSLDNSGSGLLATPGQLLLRNLAQLNNSGGGEVSSQQGFALQLTTLNNQGGKLLSDGALGLTADSLDNRQGGVISAKGALDLRGAALLNSQSGRIHGGADLLLAQTRVDNSDHGRIEALGRISGQVRTLDQHNAGQLVSNGGIDLVFAGGSLDNSGGGLLATLGQLLLRNLAQLNNSAGGEVSSQQGFALQLTTLNNQGGKLLSDRALSLTTHSLDNRQGGVISAKGVLDLRGATLLNSQSGRILGGADLLLTQSRVDNSDHGRIEAVGRVSGQAQTLDQHNAGQLVSNGGIDLDFGGGSFDNSADGLLASSGALQLRNLAQLNNSAGGEVSSHGSLVLQATVLNNQGGKLLTDDALTVDSQSLDNRQNGVISAKGALTLRGTSLLNSQSGRILGGADLLLAQSLVDNSGRGRIEAVGRVAGQVRTLDQHGAGQLVSNGSIDLDFASGSLDNSAGGLLATPGQLLLRNLAQLNNSAGGEVSSQQGFALNLSGLNNQGGKLLTDGALNLTVQSLDNRQGGVISAKGALTLRGATLLNSQSGRILGGADLLLVQSLVDNSGRGRIEAAGRISGQVQTLDQHGAGQLVSNGGIDLDFAGGTLDNSIDGLLATSGALQLRNLAQLNNSAGGEVSSQGSFALQAAALNNQGGKLLTDDALTVDAQSLDNRQSGMISAKGALTLRGATLLNSQSGRISGGADLLLAHTRVDNSDHGRIEAAGRISGQVQTLDQKGAGQLVSNGGIDLDFAGGSLDNSAGGLLATSGAMLLRNLTQLNNSAGGEVSSQGNLTLQLTTLNNQGGKLLSEGALSLTAQSLDNRQGGWVGAMRGIELQASELFNQGGEISSRAAVSLDVGQLDNSTGLIASDDRLELRGDSLVNRAGSLVGQGGLNLDGHTLDNSQGGKLSSLGDLTLNLAERLDNQAGGQLISEGTLNLSAAQVDNRAGVLSSGGALSVTSTTLNNQGGKLLTDAALSADAQTLDNRQGGVISAKGALTLRGASLLNSQSGRILGGADLLLAQSLVDNSGRGRIEAVGRVAGQVRTLDQHGAGQLVSNGGIDLDFAGGSLDNSTGGLLATPGQLLLRNLAQLNNSNGGEISSQQSYVLAVAGLNNQGGRILSSDGLTLQVQGTADNSQAGVLFGRNQLQLDAVDLNNSQGGTVASQGAIQARLQGNLDNHADGALAAGGNLSVTSASLNNQGGSLSGGQNLTLVTGTTDNQHGRITAQAALDARTAALDNRAGILSGKQSQRLQAQAIDSRAGLITTQGGLELSGSRVDNSQGGEISAGGALQLRVQQLIQQQGRLITDGDLTLDLAGGDFDNRNAVLSVGGLLRLDHLRHLDNRGGEISSQNSFQLSAASLDNGDAGRIISGGTLQLTTGTLRNANQGLLSGWQGLVINAADLDNSTSGTLSSKQGALDVTLSGSLDNHGEGALVSLGDQRINAARLDNRGGILSGQRNLDLTIAGTLDNSTGGLINAQQHLALNPAQTDILNQGGQISAGSIDLSARSLDNSGGLLLSQGALHGTLSGALINANNARLASGGELLLRAASLNNRGGQLASQQRLELNAGSLENSQRGTLASQQDLTLNLGTGTLDNSADGLLHSASGAISVTAGYLNNQGGTLNSRGDARLQLSGLLDNSRQGRIQSGAGQLLLQSAGLDNSAGGILYSATSLLRLLTGSFNNNAGITQAQQLDITANGGLDNRGGHLSAVSGDSRISTTTLDNRNGGLYAGGLLQLRGGQLLNDGVALGQGGRIGGGAIDFSLASALNNQFGQIESSGALTLGAASIDNVVGSIRALGQGGATQIHASGLLNNNLGRIESANQNFGIQSGVLQNGVGTVLHVGSGDFALDLAQAGLAGGSFVSNGSLRYRAANLTNSAIIQARILDLDVGQLTQSADGRLLASQTFTGRGDTWNNGGLIASDGSLDLQLTGTYSNNGRLTSLGNLNLSAAQLDLNATGSVVGGSTAQVSANTLNNRSRLTAADDLTVNAGSLNNFGTLGSAGRLGITTWDLLNDGEQSGALIFSGDDMALHVGGTLTNRFADIYSLGNLDVAANGQGGWTQSVENHNSTIESAGDLSLLADSIRNAGTSQGGTPILVAGAIGSRCYDCTDTDPRNFQETSHLVWMLKYKSAPPDSVDSASILAGGNLRAVGGRLDNSSVISAGSDIRIDVGTFNNQGASYGDYTVLKSFDYPYNTKRPDRTESFWAQAMAYNAANDPDYDSGIIGYVGSSNDVLVPNVHFWNKNFDEFLKPVGRIRTGAKDGEWFQSFGSVKIQQSFDSFPDPSYASGVRTEAPDLVKNAAFFDERIIQTGTSSFSNAVVQAGGNVAINATQDLKNSVIREGVPQSSGTSRVGDTGVTGNATTVVALNAQLPPDIAQQQVNPITLPGFSLPTGSNGLFRLSGQEGSQIGAQTVAGGGSYTFAGQSISLSQRERALDGATGMTGDIQRSSDALGMTGDIQRGATGMTGDVQRSNGAAGSTGDIQRNNSATGTTGDVQRSGATGTTGDIQRNTGAAGMTGDVQRIAGATGTADAVQLKGGATAQGVAAGASLNVAQVQGVPSAARPDNSHKYLIETNPELTSLKSFLGSDYLLGQLGYDPDKSQKRLGDGLYEQRLIRDAVVARTGQRFIDGMASDEALFKYLMDNTIAYKDSLHLSLGVGLTAEQVAALTHDIVWLEEAMVNGEKVLVPVVYLAQANNRLAPNGALIMGNDVSLISGGNLTNQGTLRASGDLAASAANLDNTGLIEASGRLALLALNNLSNTQGGIINGRDVSLSALTGDVINQRSVTVHEGGNRNRTWTESFADSTARIEAAGKLEISAGRDINNLGGALSSGSDLSMQAGRDINLHSVEVENGTTRGRNYNQTTTQLGSEISVGRDFTLEAGRDISVVGSRIDVARDIGLSAGRDVTLASAADEQHSYDKSKKVTRQEDHVTQRGTELSAGRDVLISAGQDLTLISSKISAGNEAYLVAGDKIEVLAANDSDYSLYDKKSKGSFGQKKTRHDEVTDVKAVSSEISAGSDITLLSGGDQKYQAAKLDSGNDIAIVSGGEVNFEAVKDLHQEAHEKSNSSLAWNSAKGKGKTDETVRQSELIAQGNLAIKAVDGLKIDYKQIDKQSVSQAIDAMVKADPNLAWLKEAEARGDVDWRAVKEFHDSYSYSQSGMGPATQLAVAIAAAAIGGMAAAGALSGAGVAGGTFAMGAGVGAAGSLAGTAGVSLINNKGDLGKVLSDSFSSDNLKQMAIASLVGGLTTGYFDDWTGTKTQVPTDKIISPLSTAGGIGGFAANQALQNVTATALSKAMGEGGSFGDALQNTLYNTLAATAFNAVGDAGLKTGSAEKVAVHALVGGLVAEASGGDFSSGAIAAGANEALANELRQAVTQMSPEKRDALLSMSSELVGVVAVSLVDQNQKHLETGAWVAKNATQYNFLNHDQTQDFVHDITACGSNTQCQQNVWVGNGYNQDSLGNLKDALKTAGPARAKDLLTTIQGGLAALAELNCTTTTCESYKFELIDRSIRASEYLDEVFGFGATVIGAVAGMGGVGVGAKRPGGTVAPGASSSVNKAYEYWGAVRAERAAAANAGDAAASARPTPRQSEIDVGAELGSGARPQVSYKNGQEVPYGTAGSVRPDWCLGNVCSVEVKNYNVATNQQGLINNVSQQALKRVDNLPQGMQQQVVIDVRGQAVSDAQKNAIIRGVVDKSNGVLKPTDIRFKE